MIDEGQKREIRRLFYAEHWPIGTIVTNLGIHPDTVRRAISSESFQRRTSKSSDLAPYKAFLTKTLEEYPRIRSTRLHQMVAERGYEGSVYPIRRLVATIRPRLMRAYQDLYFLPGEMAQIDWASFGRILVGQASRTLMCFVMVLAYSRMIFARMFYDQKLPRVLDGHRRAFEFFQGVPRVCLYDNMKTAVIENLGDAIRFNPELNRLSGHYRFKPRACNPRSGWEKGRVERAIRYIRENFFEARRFVSLDDLNDQLQEWIVRVPPQRAWQDDTTRTVGMVFEEEKLLPLPDDPYPVYEERSVVANKKAFIHFDSNRYSLPPEGASKNLSVRATFEEVSIYDGSILLAKHTRSWSRDEKINAPDHQKAIAEQARIRARRQSRSILTSRLPGVGEELLKLWVTLEENLSFGTKQLLDLIETYGSKAVDEAARDAIGRGTPSPDSIRFILENATELPPPAKIKPRIRKELEDIETRSHDLSTYDSIGDSHDHNSP